MIIEYCKKEDKERLIEFLRNYWSESHILVRSKEFLEWQHGNPDGGLNFLIAKDENNVIWGVEGFIPIHRYDSDILLKEGYNNIWGAIWKVRPDCPIPGLGVLLSRRLQRDHDFLGGLGLSKDAQTYYKIIKADYGLCNHFYVLNPCIKDFKIAVINKSRMYNSCDESCSVGDLKSLNDVELKHAYKPYKTVKYLINRYEKHPIYIYHFLSCSNEERIQCILVYRIIEVNQRKCARIVDMVGDLSKITNLGYALRDYLKQHPQIEYFDIYNHGISAEYFIDSGFQVNDGVDIIPNYFEPFVQVNVPLHYSILSKDKTSDYVFFKGDADQDRPNFII